MFHVREMMFFSISQQVYCEEREARSGNLYQTRNAPFYIAIASSDALRVLLAMTGCNAGCPLPENFTVWQKENFSV
jgi:hypothetical protein